MKMKFEVMTLFPDMVSTVLSESIIGRAEKADIIKISCHNIRDYTDDKHRRVDDYPYGGGQGMLLKAEPIAACFDAIARQVDKKPLYIYMSPQGEVFRQSIACEFAEMDNICILCGHYEGVDDRLIEQYIDRQISLGDFVLTGGELAALAVTDAVARLLPGVLSESTSFEDESHYSGLLEYPQYTRPAVWRGMQVPEVLTSGNQRMIEQWKRQKSIEVTARLRPDMLEKYTQSDSEGVE